MGTFIEVLSVIGFVIRALGFAVLGFAVGRFTWTLINSRLAGAGRFGGWFLALLVGLTNYASPASMGMFAIAAGAA